MRKILICALTFSTTALLVGMAQPSRAGGDQVVASATGGGNIELFGAIRVFAFNAEKHVDGTVTGQLEIRYLPFNATIHGEIDCLRVVGNEAIMSGPVTKSNFPPVQPGFRGVVVVRDNGEGASAPPDMINWPVLPAPAGQDCSTVTPTPNQPVVFGDVQVRGG